MTISLKDQVSEAEWQLRVDLAAAYRLVAMFGWDDLVFTHISARIPGPEHHFLINPYGMMFEEITASSLVKIDLNGEKVADSPYPVNPAGFTIHSRFSGYVYQATIAGGYGRRLLKTPKMTWDAEIGPGFRISEFENGSAAGDGQVSEAILHLSTEFKAAVSETATFVQKLSAEAGDENTVTKSVTSLKTKIVGGLGLKLSYTMTYNETVPTGTVHMDRETAVTLVYNF